MAEGRSERTVIIPVDNSDHSERAFQCKFTFIYCPGPRRLGQGPNSDKHMKP